MEQRRSDDKTFQLRPGSFGFEQQQGNNRITRLLLLRVLSLVALPHIYLCLTLLWWLSIQLAGYNSYRESGISESFAAARRGLELELLTIILGKQRLGARCHANAELQASLAKQFQHSGNSVSGFSSVWVTGCLGVWNVFIPTSYGVLNLFDTHSKCWISQLETDSITNKPVVQGVQLFLEGCCIFYDQKHLRGSSC